LEDFIFLHFSELFINKVEVFLIFGTEDSGESFLFLAVFVWESVFFFIIFLDYIND